MNKPMPEHVLLRFEKDLDQLREEYKDYEFFMTVGVQQVDKINCVSIKNNASKNFANKVLIAAIQKNQ